MDRGTSCAGSHYPDRSLSYLRSFINTNNNEIKMTIEFVHCARLCAGHFILVIIPNF